MHLLTVLWYVCTWWMTRFGAATTRFERVDDQPAYQYFLTVPPQPVSIPSRLETIIVYNRVGSKFLYTAALSCHGRAAHRVACDVIVHTTQHGT